MFKLLVFSSFCSRLLVVLFFIFSYFCSWAIGAIGHFDGTVSFVDQLKLDHGLGFRSAYFHIKLFNLYLMKLSFEINFSNAGSSSLISNSCVFPKIEFWVKVNIIFLGKVNISSIIYAVF